MHDSYERVEEDHEPEQGVLCGSDNEDQDEQRAEQRVEASEDVRPDDLAETSARPLVGGVDVTARDALGHLGLGETFGWRLGTIVDQVTVVGHVRHVSDASGCSNDVLALPRSKGGSGACP